MSAWNKQFVTVVDRWLQKEEGFPTTDFLFLILTPGDLFKRISHPLNVVTQNEVNDKSLPPPSSSKNTHLGQRVRSYDQKDMMS